LNCCEIFLNVYFYWYKSVMIAQWENERISPIALPRGLGSISGHGRALQGTYPWLITLAIPSEASLTGKGSISPQWYHITRHKGGMLKSNHGQTLTESINKAGSAIKHKAAPINRRLRKMDFSYCQRL